MSTKSIILSSAGLKNIVLNNFDSENQFNFIFGDYSIKMNRIFAEFLSPMVSRLRSSDSTVSSIQFDKLFHNFEISSNIYSQTCHELFTEDVISLIEQISSGFSIEINRHQSFQLQLISILLENEELFDQINEIYPIDISESNVDLYLQHLEFFYLFSKASCRFNYPNIVDFISSHFYMLKPNQLIGLPKSLLLKLLSNKNLLVESEDSLFSLIQSIFTKSNDDTTFFEEDFEYDIIDFYELLEPSFLSENKFRDFLLSFDLSDMNNTIWAKIIGRFLQSTEHYEHIKNNRYLHQNPSFEFDGDPSHRFDGIIMELTRECNGNVQDKGIVKVTSSSHYANYYPKYAVDFNDNQHYYFSNSQPNSWLKFDFIQRRIRPTMYSIKSRHDDGQSGCHLKCWVIEGSNSGLDNDWKILDSRENVTELDERDATSTYKIKPELNNKESYRFLRLRQTGVNTAGNNYLSIAALEFFGSVISS